MAVFREPSPTRMQPRCDPRAAPNVRLARHGAHPFAPSKDAATPSPMTSSRPLTGFQMKVIGAPSPVSTVHKGWTPFAQGREPDRAGPIRNEGATRVGSIPNPSRFTRASVLRTDRVGTTQLPPPRESPVPVSLRDPVPLSPCHLVPLSPCPLVTPHPPRGAASPGVLKPRTRMMNQMRPAGVEPAPAPYPGRASRPRDINPLLCQLSYGRACLNHSMAYQEGTHGSDYCAGKLRVQQSRTPGTGHCASLSRTATPRPAPVTITSLAVGFPREVLCSRGWSHVG